MVRHAARLHVGHSFDLEEIVAVQSAENAQQPHDFCSSFGVGFNLEQHEDQVVKVGVSVVHVDD
jgi:hypothetical protein